MRQKISIVIPVYNGEKTLSLCLNSLINLNYPKEELEIIIVDNNSVDETANIVKQYPVKYVFEPQRNRARARNKGIKSAKGRFIAFIDADCVAHKNWIRNLLKAYDDPHVGGCGGKIYVYNPFTLWEKYAENRGLYDQKNLMNETVLIPSLRTGNAMYPKSILEKIDLFDETFYNTQDRDLSFRIALCGFKLAYVPDAIVYHKHRNGLGNLCKQFYGYGKGGRTLYAKYKNIAGPNPKPGVFHPKMECFKKLSIREKLVEILFLPIDLACYLAYLTGWLSFYFSRHPSMIKPPKELSFIPSKVFRKLDEKLIISNVSKRCNYALGNMGTKIYELLTLGVTETEIIDRLSEEYDVSKDRLTRDFTEFVSELKKEKLL